MNYKFHDITHDLFNILLELSKDAKKTIINKTVWEIIIIPSFPYNDVTGFLFSNDTKDTFFLIEADIDGAKKIYELIDRESNGSHIVIQLRQDIHRAQSSL